ncbi:MFS transporter [uncultured Agrococcus sp.]|uniref:MFS transporter n=1 Tax=uncultured Agrococcus sp. TaxID=382258 RepID=UPI0025EBDB4E|nr:MFS transporter [uncultured Agrococcus sp.]
MPIPSPRSWSSLGRPFGYLWSASALTNLGDGILLAAGPLLIASLTSSPALVGGAVLIQQLPWLLFALFSGAIADRLDKRRLIVAINVSRALTMVLLAGFVATGSATVLLVYVTLFILGVGETFADSASSPLVVATVPAEELGRANARLGLTFTMGNQLAGPPLGAVLFAFASAIPLAAQAVTFILGAVLVSRVRLDTAPGGPARPLVRGVMADVREGLRWLRSHRPLLTLIGAILVMNVAFMTAFATWVLYSTRLLGLNEFQFGLLVTCSAIGGLAGPLAYGLVKRRVGHAGILRFAFFFEGGMFLLFATVPPAWVVAATMVVFGTHTMVWGTAATTLIQQTTPKPLLARVTSIYAMANIGGSAVGAAIGATIAELFGLTTGFWVGGALVLIVAVASWRSVRAIRPADDRTGQSDA